MKNTQKHIAPYNVTAAKAIAAKGDFSLLINNSDITILGIIISNLIILVVNLLGLIILR